MSVNGWSWISANPVTNKPGVSYFPFDATAEQVKAAYSTLKNKGKISEFSTAVWNDFCGKIRDMNIYWETNKAFGNESSPVWVYSPNSSDYPDDSTYEKYKDKGGKLYASAMNAAASGILMFEDKSLPWEKSLGRKYLQSGDDVKAEYLFSLARFLNFWCSLEPLFFSFSLKASFKQQSTEAVVLPSLPIAFDELAMKLSSKNKSIIFTSIPLQVLLKLYHKSTIESIALPYISVSSALNFMTLNDKVYVECDNTRMLNLDDISAVFDSIVSVMLLSEIDVIGENNFILDDNILAEIFTVQGVKIQDNFLHNSSVNLAFASPFSFTLNDKISAYTGTGHLRNFRAVPVAAYTEFLYDSLAAVSHKGILILPDVSDEIPSYPKISADTVISERFAQSGLINIADSILLSNDTAQQLLQNTSINIAKDISMISGKGAILEDNKNIILNSETPKLLVDDSTKMRHTASVSTENEFDLSCLDFTAHQLSDNLETSFAFELSFSNEDLFELASGYVAVNSGEISLEFADTNAMLSDSIFNSTEIISLENVNPLLLSSENLIDNYSTASLNKSHIFEVVGAENFTAFGDAEIDAFLDTLLESENAQIDTSSSAQMYSLELAVFEANICGSSSYESGECVALLLTYANAGACISSKSTGDMATCLMRFAVSVSSISANSDAEISDSNPTHFSSKKCYVNTSYAAFLDYGSGKSLYGNESIYAEVSAQIERIYPDTRFSAKVSVNISCESELNKPIASVLLSSESVENSSIGELETAFAELIPASEHEEKFVSALDDILADKCERNLIFDD